MFIACLLVYSFFVVPIQLSVWVTDDVCSLPPTQYFDMFTEICFLVLCYRPCKRLARASDFVLAGRDRVPFLRRLRGQVRKLLRRPQHRGSAPVLVAIPLLVQPRHLRSRGVD